MAEPISPSAANTQKQDYVNYMTGLGVNMNAQTQSVSFDSTVLLHWMNSLGTFADEFRLFMGLNTNGRTTVIVWPYKNGVPAVDSRGTTIQPFNDGQGIP